MHDTAPGRSRSHFKFSKILSVENYLFIVSTPIGNIKDISLRALEILQNVQFIACEDTRITSILLNQYKIKKRMVSLNAVNEKTKIPYMIKRIIKGESCALVSDAGTPCISDPGVRLVSAALKENIHVVPVPGATAVITALTISGLPTDSFVFEGFLPQKKGRQKKLELLSKETRTIVLYESKYRIGKLINEIEKYMPDRIVVVCRELTKKFEEVWRDYPSELLKSLPGRITKGEFVVVISPIDWKEDM